jgi:phage N-6-adenine-methyltransferase
MVHTARISGAVRAVLGDIDLDPASSKIAQKRVRAKKYFTKFDDALNREWHGRVWLNPPYSRDEMPRFIEKLVVEFQAGRVNEAIVLSNSYTDTSWFHRLASFAAAICFTRGRIHFVSLNGGESPVHGQAFFYLGSNRAKFIEEFGAFGLVVLPVEKVAVTIEDGLKLARPASFRWREWRENHNLPE